MAQHQNLKDGKVSGIVCFHNQDEYKNRVLKSIKPQVNQLIVVEGKGNLTKQRNYGIKQAKHEYLLFVDGDIIVGNEFVNYAKGKFVYTDVGVVGGRMTTECKTPVQELMAILRENAYLNNLLVAGCFLTKREYFKRGAEFGYPPYETTLFLKWIEVFNLTQARVDIKLLHLGEPKTITQLLQRQCKYGTKYNHNLIRWVSVRLLFVSPLMFLLKYGKIYYKLKKEGKIKTPFGKLANIYDSFITVFYESAILKKSLKVEN